MDPLGNLIVAFVIVLAGVLYRTARPYMVMISAYEAAADAADNAGLKPGDPKYPKLPAFQRRYVLTGMISFATAMVAAAFIISTGSPLLADPLANAIPLFCYAVGQTEIINRELLTQ